MCDDKVRTRLAAILLWGSRNPFSGTPAFAQTGEDTNSAINVKLKFSNAGEVTSCVSTDPAACPLSMRVVAATLLLFFLACGGPSTPEASLISESRTKAFRVSIVELPVWIDRNFEIWVERKDGVKTNIFRSPDEGRPIGTERIVWRRDHSQFVVVGRHFGVDNGPSIPMDVLYLLYDVPTGRVWCNASQKDAPRFTMENLKDWGGSYENDMYRRPAAK